MHSVHVKTQEKTKRVPPRSDNTSLLSPLPASINQPTCICRPLRDIRPLGPPPVPSNTTPPPAAPKLPCLLVLWGGRNVHVIKTIGRPTESLDTYVRDAPMGLPHHSPSAYGRSPRAKQASRAADRALEAALMLHQARRRMHVAPHPLLPSRISVPVPIPGRRRVRLRGGGMVGRGGHQVAVALLQGIGGAVRVWAVHVCERAGEGGCMEPWAVGRAIVTRTHTHAPCCCAEK